MTLIHVHGATTELEIKCILRADAPVVLIVPAMGVPARFYRPLLDALHARGAHAAVADLRGIGTSSVRAGRDVDFDYATLVGDLVDTLRAFDAASPNARGRFLLGHSLGGHLSLLALARDDRPPIDGVVVVASGAPHFATLDGRYALLGRVLGHLAPPLSAIVGHFPGGRLGFGGRQPRTLMTEWARFARTGVLPGDTRALRSVRTPILGVGIAGDGYAPPRSMDALLANAPLAEVTRVVEGTKTAEISARNHHRWVRAPDAIATRVVDWATNVLGRTSVGSASADPRP